MLEERNNFPGNLSKLKIDVCFIDGIKLLVIIGKCKNFIINTLLSPI